MGPPSCYGPVRAALNFTHGGDQRLSGSGPAVLCGGGDL